MKRAIILKLEPLPRNVFTIMSPALIFLTTGFNILAERWLVVSLTFKTVIMKVYEGDSAAVGSQRLMVYDRKRKA